ncbi:MAG TPA: hypothetical protein ENH46_05625 [Candidatus Pacearchaeota archaeon]|nr:hypothetical protein [Candidatus Pacearchaeota archaeon]
MVKKTQNEEIEMAILELLQNKIRSMSIRELTNELEKDFKIKRSPQIIKRHLKSLIEKGDIREIK